MIAQGLRPELPLGAPTAVLREFTELAPGKPSLNDHRTAIFAHEVANSLSAIGYSIEFIKSELIARQIADPTLNRIVQSALSEIAGLGAFLHNYCAPPLPDTLDYEVVDFAQLVEEVLALQSLACLAAGVIVGFEREPAVSWVRLDASKIKQVVTNLCKNAMEAIPDGGHISVKVNSAERSVILEVTDDGIGVPTDVDVFELFKSTKRLGRGVGLAVAREIVAAHHGAIAYNSEFGRGTTFKVTLPMAESRR